jgi:phage terminase large subunit
MADAARQIVIPYLPRPQFMPLHERERRWGIVVAHRRAGKTVAVINELIKAALTCPLPEPHFAYIAPYRSQAKDVAWSYLKQFTAPIPGIEHRESDLKAVFPNGGFVRLWGADNYDSMRGNFFDGVVMDEYGDIDPRAFAEVLRPALSDRRGWALFCGTPKGRNHFAEQWEKARQDGDWFTLMLRASETGLVAADELADARKMMSEDQYAAEYECSFDAMVIGAYFSREMQAAEVEKRISNVPWDPALPVHTSWDLGIGDSTAIWFIQRVGREWRFIDYIENSGVGLDWYAREIDKRPYKLGECLLPHDAKVHELGAEGRSRVETLELLGMKRIRVNPRRAKEDSINAGRLVIMQSWFDATKCARGIEALRNYRREWDEKRKVFHDKPLHDWTSHGTDAFMEGAAGDPHNDDPWSKPLKFSDRGIV